MDRIKYTLRILGTNWIHFIGFYVTTYLILILFKLIGLEGTANEGWTEIIFLSLLTIPPSVLCLWRNDVMIIGGFIGTIAILDIIGFNLKTNNTKLILIIKWLIIIPTFINWAFKYDYWLWITLSISFLVTQLMRVERIEKINKKNALQQSRLTANSGQSSEK